jgi:predicted AAA+ superfamily ATPase
MKKVYLSHPSLVFGISKHYYELLPKVMECFILDFLNAEYYWREKDKEVDFIIERNGTPIPVEVKYKDKITKSDLKDLLKFMEKFKIREGSVITKDLLEEREIKGKIIRFTPICLSWKLL